VVPADRVNDRSPVQSCSLQTIFSYCVLRPTQPPASNEMEKSSSLRSLWLVWNKGLVYMTGAAAFLLVTLGVQLSIGTGSG